VTNLLSDETVELMFVVCSVITAKSM